MKKKTSLFLALVVTALCLAEGVGFGQVGLIPGANDPSKADLKVMTENRSLISTTIDPSKLQAEGYVVGMDQGTVDINDFKDFLEGVKANKKNNIVLATTSTEPPRTIPKLNTIKHRKKHVLTKRHAQNTVNKI